MIEKEVIEILEEYILQLEHSIAEGECTELNEDIGNAIQNDKKSIEAFEVAIAALKENQKYHEIGTVKECRELASIFSKIENNELLVIIDEWCEYCKIGTLEEVRNQKQNLEVAYKNISDFETTVKNDWIPVGHGLPKSDLNPVTRDAYVYPVTVDFGDVTDVRYYSFWEGHWYNNSPFPVDKYVTAWMDRPQPYKPETYAEEAAQNTRNKAAYWRDRTQYNDFRY